MSSGARPAYVSGGQMLESPPLSQRFNRAIDNAYNFFGLYFISLFSLDPYTAAQNSQFNTRGRGPSAPQNRAPRGTGNGGTSGARAAPSGGAGRRMGTLNDVRGSEQ